MKIYLKKNLIVLPKKTYIYALLVKKNDTKLHKNIVHPAFMSLLLRQQYNHKSFNKCFTWCTYLMNCWLLLLTKKKKKLICEQQKRWLGEVMKNEITKVYNVNNSYIAFTLI